MSTHPLTDNYGREITVTLNEDGSTIAESTSLTIDWPQINPWNVAGSSIGSLNAP
jgi:hypothetical protein